MKVSNLRKDILNSVSHIFGEHKMCQELKYFCNKSSPDTENLIEDFKHAGMYENVLIVVRRLANHARSLIFDVDSNIVEKLNANICKFIGGKRVNYAL